MPAWLGPAISAGASVLGGLLNRSSSSAARRDSNVWNYRSWQQAERAFQASEHWNQEGLELARDQFERGLQTRVADAKAAGLHPLYALGAAGGGGGGSFTGGGAGVFGGGGSGYDHGSGSGIGTAIEGIGDAVGRYYSDRYAREEAERDPLRRAQIRAQNASAARDEAAAKEADSRRKLAEQAANATGRGRFSDDTGETVYAPAGPGDRATIIKPREHHSFRQRFGDLEVMNPGMGADELLQLDIVWQLLNRYFQDSGEKRAQHMDKVRAKSKEWFIKALDKGLGWYQRYRLF